MPAKKPKVVIVGSFMLDLVVKAPRRPQKGETLVGTDFGMFTGGKGYNQAVAAARLGAEVHMVGRLGADYFGDLFMQAMARDGIHTDFVVRDPEVGTGVGTPVVDADGDNSIVIIPRANMRLTPADVEQAADAIAAADVLLLQLEVPLEASLRAAEIAHKHGAKVILNPAPARELPDEFLRPMDILTPNEIETAMLTGLPTGNLAQVELAATVLLARGGEAVVVTLGERGALLVTHDLAHHIPGYTVPVVDTTAAGDAFCGALAVALARGVALEPAVRYANAAGALAVTVMGAEPSMPAAEKLVRFFNSSSPLHNFFIDLQ